MQIRPTDTLLFTGDSITDHARDREISRDLGHGYVSMVAARLQAKIANPDMRIYNRGISGNRVYDLEARLDPDVIALRPSIVTILVGINDVWRHYDSNIPSPIEGFRSSYVKILHTIRRELKAQIIIMEPFLLPIPDDRRIWRAQLDPKIHVIRSLAVEYNCLYIPLDGLFAAAACRAPASFWTPDGVHPSAAGDALIAEAWLDRVQLSPDCFKYQ
jgi:acyl-CoA thioesterase I